MSAKILILMTGLALVLCAKMPAAEEAAEDATQPVEIEEHPLVGLMRQLPDFKNAEPSASPDIEGLQAIMPGLYIVKQKRIILNALIVFYQGPQDGLEAVACMVGGKSHESMMVLECPKGALIKSLFIANLGLLEDGEGSPQDSGIPVRGFPVRVLLRWRPDPVLEPDQWVERDVSTLVRDRVANQAYPPLPYMYTGSRFLTQTVADPEGGEREQKLFMLDNTKTLLTNYDEPDALLGSPFPLAQFDLYFEVNSADCPSEDTKVELHFAPATLPLTISMDKDGVLKHADKALDEAAVEALLKQHYSSLKLTDLRAIGIQVEAGTARDKDVAMREWMLKRAVKAGVWAVPVFIPAPKAE